MKKAYSDDDLESLPGLGIEINIFSIIPTHVPSLVVVKWQMPLRDKPMEFFMFCPGV